MQTKESGDAGCVELTWAMGIKKFFTNLFDSLGPRGRSEPTPPMSSEDYAEEIEFEKERRRGMRGD